jgi:serine/threonine-protein kinase
MIVKGQKINDRYQIIKTIGEGGMANVYLAYDTILDRNVAVKVLRGDLATDEKFVRRFQREALSASSLSHPNIVEVYDVGEDNGSYYIVMEYIEGKQLKQLLKKRGKLTLNEVVDIMSQVTDGMSAAHDSYIIHRDIKPQNIMILENGLIKITDFGIAMALNSTQLTQTNSVMGSVHYLPPEQASGKGATIQSDVYSMGILMYELLTGELPFRGDNAVEIALKQIKEPVPSIRTKIENIPQSIENIIYKATAKNPKNRYKDAREMHDDLKTALSKERENEPKYVFKYAESNDENIKKSEVRTTPVPTDQEMKKAERLKSKIDKNDEFLDKFAETNEIKATKIEDTKAKAPKKKVVKDDKDEKKQENKLLLILAIIFTSLFVIVTALVIVIPKFTTVKEVKIPDVKNMSVVEAEEKLEALGLTVENEVKTEDSSDVQEGNVTRTSPQIGRTVKKGSTITLYVSIGEGGLILDDYTGQNYNKVQGILEEKDIFVVIKKEEPEDYNKVTADQVLRQEPAKGTVVKSGETVTLYVPDMNTTYPDFTDGSWNLEKIQSWCEKYSVTYVEPQYTMTNDYSEGAIYKQNPAPGTRVQTGQRLQIYIAENFDETEDGTGTGEE